MAHAKNVGGPVLYELVLTEVEAATLHTILRRVGGIPTHSPRKFSEAILDALVVAGAPRLYDTDETEILVSGSIRFEYNDAI